VTEREWREAIDMRSSLVSLGLVVVSAALLRYWNLRHGAIMPFEGQILDGAHQVVQSGSYRPLLLVRPSLPVYLHATVSVALFMWGAITGAWRTLADFGPDQMLLCGRAVSALLGTVVVVVVYFVGGRWGARHALLAAGLMAVMPTHVGASREVGAGSPLTLFSALTLLLSIKALERPSRRAFALAGIAVGLAAASDYPGALTVMLPVAAAWMTTVDDPSRLARVSWTLVAAIVAFVISTPIAVLNLPVFLNGFAASVTPRAAGAASRIDLFEQLVWALQWPALVLAISGLCLGVVRAITGPGHARWTLLVSFPVVYVSALAWHGAASDGILLPALPSIAVLAALAVISGVSQLRRFAIPRAARTALIAALTVAAVLPPAVLSIELVSQAKREALRGSPLVTGRPDTGR
jgi:hypothetical protein